MNKLIESIRKVLILMAIPIVLIILLSSLGAAYNNPLDVPFKTQFPPGIAFAVSKNCGQTSSLMLYSYYDGTIPTEEGIRNIDDWLFLNYGESQAIDNYNGAYTKTTELETLAAEYGGEVFIQEYGGKYGDFPYSYKVSGWNVARVKQEIDAGHPVIVAVTGAPLGQSYGGHFLVAKGYTSSSIITNDPGRTIGELTYTNTQFENAMSSQGGSVVVVLPKAMFDLQCIYSGNTGCQSISSVVVKQGDELNFVYRLKTAFPDAVEYTVLGAQIKKSNTEESWIDIFGSIDNDNIMNLIPGTYDYSRKFKIPNTIAIGSYDVRWILVDTGTGKWIGVREQKAILKVETAGTPIPSIKVDSPNNGESWQAGSQHSIKWTSNGNPGGMAKIELLKNGRVVETLSLLAVPIDGLSKSYLWSIPADKAFGIDYQIRVTSSTNPEYTDTSDGYFTIGMGVCSTSAQIGIKGLVASDSCATPPTISGQSVYCNDTSCGTTTVAPGDKLTFVYSINNPNSYDITNVRLGAQIRTNNPQGGWIDDWDRDKVVILKPGTYDYSRDYIIKSDAVSGYYDAKWVILDNAYPYQWFDSKDMLRIFQVQSTPTLISNIYDSPSSPTSSDSVHIYAGISAADGVSSVQTKWSLDQSFSNIINMINIGGDSYRTTSPIPVQSSATTVYYKICASDTKGNSGCSSVNSYIVSQSNWDPVVGVPSLNPNLVTPGQAVAVSASVSDPDGNIPNNGVVARVENSIGYVFDQTTLTYNSGIASGSITAPSQLGSYYINILATDSNGATGSNKADLNVQDSGNICVGSPSLTSLDIKSNEKGWRAGGRGHGANGSILPITGMIPANDSERSGHGPGGINNESIRILSGSYYTFSQSTESRDVGVSPDYDPIDETHVFKTSDIKTVTWVHLTNLYEEVRLKVKWYRPDGQFYTEYIGEWTNDPKDYGYNYYYWWKLWSWIYIKGNDVATYPGKWRAEIYIEEAHSGAWKYETTEYFTIGYELTDHTMETDHQPTSPFDPITRTNSFSPDDVKSESWLRFDKVPESLVVKWEWYHPLGSKWSDLDINYTIPDPSTQGSPYWEWYKSWGYICVKDYKPAYYPGDWQTKVYINDVYKYTEDWKTLDIVAPSVGSLRSPQSPTDQDSISITVNSNDNAGLNKVELYWNDGTLHTEIWNSPANPFSGTKNIGKFSVGKTIQYYAKAYDTSGKTTQTSTYSFSILDGAPPSISVSHSPANPTDKDNIFLIINATDNSIINKVELYWNDGTLQNQTWYPNLNSFSLDYNIGKFEGSRVVQYYAKAYDESGKIAISNTYSFNPLVLANITVSPRTASVLVGDGVPFDAIKSDQNGNFYLPNVNITWTSSNKTVGIINGFGMFTALTAGTSIITATNGSVSGSASVTVTKAAPILTKIIVSPPTASVIIGNTQDFSALAIDQYGGPIIGANITWTSSNTSVGTISTSGRVTGISAGITTVIATIGPVSGSAFVTVTQAAPILPTIRFINGTVIDSVNEISIAGVNISANSTLSTMTNATGFYSIEVAEGTYNLTAMFDLTYYTNTTTVSTIGKAVAMQDIELIRKPTGNITGIVSIV